MTNRRFELLHEASPIRIWRAAKGGRPGPPSYEEAVLGNLGRFAAGAAVMRRRADDEVVILWAGDAFEAWIGRTCRSRPLSELDPADARVLAKAYADAVRSGEPVRSRRHRVADGVLEAGDLTAFPLAARGGETWVLVHAGEDQARTNLVDAIFRATRQGMMALATLRGDHGEPIDFEIVALNEGAAAMLAHPAGKLIRRRLRDILPEAEAADAIGRLSDVLASGGRQTFEFTLADAAGRRLHLNVEAGGLGDLIALTLTDVGPIKDREASHRLLFDGNPVPMWLYDPETLRFLAVNEAAVRHYGYSRERFLAMTLLDIRPSEDWERLRQVVAAADSLQGSELLWRHRRADGELIEVMCYSSRIAFQGRPAVLVAATDVTERRRAEARIAFLAHHDPLTELANRTLFREKLAEALAQAGRRREPDGRGGGFAVHCVDLDGFKGVNDSLGHGAGDELLKEVARRLKACTRDGLDVVARLGGDEFAVLQAETTRPEEAERLAARIVDALGRPFDLVGHQAAIGASVGIAMAPADAGNPNFLLRNADMALYRAKGEGKRTYRFFEPSMDARLKARRSLEQDLRAAFDNGDLALHYQPLVSARTGRITACEALLRWRHPTRGPVPPDQFVPLAEEIGLIAPIGEWVLGRACADAARWPGEARVAVNLSPVQFRAQHRLVDAVARALGQAGLPPERLELEITESVLLRDDEANLATLRRLKALGVRIAMDDFGTGYSSLSYLRAFPFDKIKIDQSFVRELADSPHCAAIVKAVAGLGATLGITTTAEGVETSEQLERLRADGCDEVQGYLFSRPVPLADLRELLALAAPDSALRSGKLAA